MSHMLGTYDILNYVNIDYDGIVVDKRYKTEGFDFEIPLQYETTYESGEPRLSAKNYQILEAKVRNNQSLTDKEQIQYDRYREGTLTGQIKPGHPDYVRPESINITTIGLPIVKNTNVLADYLPMLADVKAMAMAGEIFNKDDIQSIGVNLLISKHTNDDVWQMMMDGNGIDAIDPSTGTKKYPSFLEELVSGNFKIDLNGDGTADAVTSDMVIRWKTKRPKVVVEAFKLYILEQLHQVYIDNK